MTRLIVLSALLIGLQSCQKTGNYTCTCTNGSSVVEKADYTNINRNTAQKRCEALQTKYKVTNTSQINNYTWCGIYDQ